MRSSLALVAVLLLAGCSGDGDGKAPDPAATGAGGTGALSGIVVDPADYGSVLDVLTVTTGEGAAERARLVRRSLAAKVYAHTAAYDAAIAAWFAEQEGERFPARLALTGERAQALRYGENPDQRAAFYVERPGAGLGIGPGSFRSSSLLAAILGSMGLIGLVCFAVHLWRVLQPGRLSTWGEDADVGLSLGGAAASTGSGSAAFSTVWPQRLRATVSRKRTK